jgi:hypothetical protein
MKSDTKVLRALEHDAERLHAGRTVIIAWLDDDKVHRALGLPSGQPASTLIQAIQKRVHPALRSEAVRVHLLHGNVEQFLRRIDAAQPNTFDAAHPDGRARQGAYCQGSVLSAGGLGGLRRVAAARP